MELAFKAIIEQLGVGGALFVIACLGIVYLYKQLSDLHKANSDLAETYRKDREALQEKRLEEAKQLLVIIERNNHNADQLMKSVHAVTTTQNELIKGFAAMVQANDLSRERFATQARLIEEAIKGNSNGINQVLSVVNARGGITA